MSFINKRRGRGEFSVVTERISHRKRKFIKRNVKRLSIEEIACKTGLSPGVVKSCIEEWDENNNKDTSASERWIGGRVSPETRPFALATLAGIVFLFALLVYLPALRGEFVWDDNEYVYENVKIREISFASLRWMLTSFHSSNWHPLTWLSHAIDCYLWGLNPFGHHLTNIILHAVNAVLVLLLCFKLVVIVREQEPIARGGYPLAVSVMAGMLFALHPLQVESVAWVSERKNLLSLFFFLLTLMAYLNYHSSFKTGRRYLWYTTTLVLFILALLSKPMVVTLPLVLLLLDFYPLRRFSAEIWAKKVVFIEKIPFFVMSLLSGVITLFAQQAGGAVKGFERLPFSFRLLNAMDSLVFYLEKMLFPLKLVPFYPFSERAFAGNTSFVLSGSIVILITAGVVWGLKRGYPFLFTVWFYYVITLLPVLGIIQVGGQKAADRYCYHPGIGVLLLLGVAGVWIWEKFSQELSLRWVRGLLVMGIVTVFCLLALKTVLQIRVWRRGEVFWTFIIETFPGKVPEAYDHLGTICVKAGRLDEAMGYYTRALVLKPHYAEGHANLGNVYLQKRMVDEAIKSYEKAIALDPALARAYTNLGLAYQKKGMFKEAVSQHQKALALNPRLAVAYYNLALVYSAQNMVDEAIAACEKVIAIDPWYAEAYNNLGIFYGRKKRMNDALASFSRAVKCNPALASAFYNRGNLYVERGEFEAALADYEKACALNPVYAMAYAGMGRVLAKQGRFEEAISKYQKALSLNPRLTGVYYNLGLSYDKVGKLDEAVMSYLRALELNPRYLEAHINLGSVYRKQGKFADAISEYQKALLLRPDLAMIHHNLGEVYYSLGEVKEAIVYYQKALVLDPRYGKAHAGLAKAYFANKEYRLAVEHNQKAKELGYPVSAEFLEKLKKYN